MEITYRKTKHGEWVAFGPADLIHEGSTVTVTKKSGQTKAEQIYSVGRTFTAKGTDCCYGYFDPDRDTYHPVTTSRQVCDEGHTHYTADCFCCANQIGL